MDSSEKRILEYLSRSFPISKYPYRTASQELGIDEGYLFNACVKFRESGIIRRIGATIDPRKIGCYSTLCAANVSEDKLKQYSLVVGGFEEVTHNYEREGNPNCWFTIISSNRKRCLEIISEIESACGIAVIELPARRIFKIDVRFSL